MPHVFVVVVSKNCIQPPHSVTFHFLFDFCHNIPYIFKCQFVMIIPKNISSSFFFSFFFFFFFFPGIKVFSYQRNSGLLNSELDLNCISCQSLLSQAAVRASRPHMFWQVNGKVTWKTPRQADTVIK